VRWLATALAVWLGLALLISGNELLRDATYRPALGRVESMALAAIVSAALVAGIARIFVALRPDVTHRQWVEVGRIWLVLTVALEFAWSWYATPEGGMLERYNLFIGRIGLLVPLAALFAPPFWSRRLYRRIDMRARFRP